MTPAISHLIAFLTSVAALVIIIVSGHGDDHLVTSLLSGVIGGSGSYSAASALGGFLNASNSTPASPNGPKNQGGFIKLAMLSILAAVSITACGIAAKTGHQTQIQNVETTCATAAGALESLSIVEQAHPLPPATLKAISQAVDAIAPVCTASTPQDYNDAQYKAANAAVGIIEQLSAQESAR